MEENNQPTPESNLEKLNRLYDKYLPKFENSGWHNTLWQIMINQNFKNIKACFTPVYKNGGLNMGIAHGLDGFTKSTAWFKEGVTYDEASDICADLNKEVFDLSDDEAFQIYAKSTWLKQHAKN